MKIKTLLATHLFDTNDPAGIKAFLQKTYPNWVKDNLSYTDQLSSSPKGVILFIWKDAMVEAAVKAPPAPAKEAAKA